MLAERKNALEAILSMSRDLHETFYSGQSADHEAQPMFVLFKNSVPTTMVCVELSESIPEKNLMVMAVRSEAEKMGADSYSFSSEGWTIPPETVKNRIPGERFADRADRIEIFNMTVGLSTGELAVQTAFIERDGGSPVLKWSPPMFNGEDGALLKSVFHLFKPLPEFLGDASIRNVN